MKTRYVTEMGMGTDVHGRDYTLAAREPFLMLSTIQACISSRH